MNEIKVGDTVWCKAHGIYSITSYHEKCKVLMIGRLNNNEIFVQVLGGEYKYGSFWVALKDFEIIYDEVSWV